MQAIPPPADIDWPNWLRRYDTQQAAYLPDREERFTAMLDVLGALLPEEFVALDLACGPGSISQRLLERFPRARVVAVDVDPVLLAMGEGALGDFDGRLRWVTADLTDPSWVDDLGESSFHAVLSTTSLQWLQVEPLVRLYNTLGTIVREEGGVFMNGDTLAFAPHQETLRLLSEATTEMQRAEAFDAGGVEDWDEWWAALAQEPSAGPLLAERTRRFASFDRDTPAPIFDVHEAALRNAGFREVGTIWQRLDNRVLLAVR